MIFNSFIEKSLITNIKHTRLHIYTINMYVKSYTIEYDLIWKKKITLYPIKSCNNLNNLQPSSA